MSPPRGVVTCRRQDSDIKGNVSAPALEVIVALGDAASVLVRMLTPGGSLYHSSPNTIPVLLPNLCAADMQRVRRTIGK